MKEHLINLWTQLSLARQFMFASCVVLVCCMAGVGWWVSREIQAGVLHETAATTALYMNSFVAPLIQELARQDHLSAEHIESLDNLVRDTPLGQEVLSFKIWNREGQIVFSTNPYLIGQEFPPSQGAAHAWKGNVATSISHLEDQEHGNERQFGERLLETYSPVRQEDSQDIIAVAEFYQPVDHLDAQLSRAKTLSWLVVGMATLAMYVILAGIVRRGSDTIERQQRDLRGKVRQLSDLLEQNSELSERVRRAASGTTARNERFLRRISAELHDGPAQCLSLALLRLDSVIAHTESCACNKPTLRNAGVDLEIVQDALREALHEIRALSAGMSLPELDDLSLPETLARVAHVHEQRTKMNVELDLDGLPADAGLPIKITLYRLIQEALSNAYRHANGIEQRIRVAGEADRLRIEISDNGPGFDWRSRVSRGEHLGLDGMRERVESMGGTFRIESEPNCGTRIHAELPLRPLGDGHDQ